MNWHRVLHRIVTLLTPVGSMVGLFEISSLLGRGSPEAYFVGTVIDLVALILIPGYVITVQLLRIDGSRFIILIPTLGFAFQLTVFLIIYVLNVASPISSTSLVSSFLVLSSVLLLVLTLSAHNRDGVGSDRPSLRLVLAQNRWLFGLLFAGLLMRLVFFQDSSTPATDGALYLAQARSFLVDGRFMANVLGDSATIPTWTQFGLSTHPIVVFGITLFFIICSPSYLSGQFMSLFSGTLLIGLSYYVARQAFGELPGIVAGILVALQPWLIFWSVVLYGPEILGSLLLMTLLTLLSLQTLAGTLTTRAAAFDAIIATLLLGAEYPAFLSMFIVLPFFLSKSFPYGRRLLIVATTYVLVLLSSPLAYFASRPDFFILTPLPLVYPILVVTMLGSLFFVLRYTRQWVKPLVVMFFSLNLGFQALLARADLAKLTIPSTQLFTTLPAPLAGTLPSYQVLARVEDIVLLQLSFWHLTRASVGDLSLILGFFAVLYGRQLNQRLSYFLILVSGSLFYTLGPVSSDLLSPNWWNFRLALPFMPVILILLSSLFRNESTSRRLPKWRVIQPRKLLAIGLVVLTIVASIPAYWQVSTSLRIFDHQALWGPVAAWASSTKPNSIFLVFDPDLWNWMSSRTSVALRVYSNSVPSYDPQSYDLGTIITLIREYHAKYVILDSSTVPTSQVVSKYFATPNTSPYGFSLNFTNTVGGITVWVYDVTTFENLTGQIATVTLNLEDNAQVYAEWPNSTYAHWAGATWWDSTVLLVGWSSGLNESRVFLKFNSSSIPTNARILNERLIIPIGFTYSSSQTATPLVIEARPTSSDWNDQQLTWLNQPHLIDSSSSKAETSYPFRGPVYLSVRPQNQTSSGISVALVPNGSTTIWRYASIYSIAGALRNEGMGVPTSLPMMEILYSY